MTRASRLCLGCVARCLVMRPSIGMCRPMHPIHLQKNAGLMPIEPMMAEQERRFFAACDAFQLLLVGAVRQIRLWRPRPDALFVQTDAPGRCRQRPCRRFGRCRRVGLTPRRGPGIRTRASSPWRRRSALQAGSSRPGRMRWWPTAELIRAWSFLSIQWRSVAQE